MKAAIELERIINEYSPGILSLDETKATLKPGPGKWSKKEILGHLVDSAQNNIRRFIVAQYEDKPYIVYAQEEWVNHSGYNDYTVQNLFRLWVLLNVHMIGILNKMTPEGASREVMTQELHSIEWLAEDYNKHLLHHLHAILDLKPIAYP